MGAPFPAPRPAGVHARQTLHQDRHRLPGGGAGAGGVHAGAARVARRLAQSVPGVGARARAARGVLPLPGAGRGALALSARGAPRQALPAGAHRGSVLGADGGDGGARGSGDLEPRRELPGFSPSLRVFA